MKTHRTPEHGTCYKSRYSSSKWMLIFFFPHVCVCVYMHTCMHMCTHMGRPVVDAEIILDGSSILLIEVESYLH